MHTDPTGLPPAYVCTLAYVTSALRSMVSALFPDEAIVLKQWRCGCSPDCTAVVLFTRTRNGRWWFAANYKMPDMPGLMVHTISNVEDVTVFLATKEVPQMERDLYTHWFKRGLKEALFSAYEPSSPG